MEFFCELMQHPPLQLLASINLPANQQTLDMLAKIPAYAAAAFQPPGFISIMSTNLEIQSFLQSLDKITIGVMRMLVEPMIAFSTMELLQTLSLADQRMDSDNDMSIDHLEMLIEEGLIEYPLTTLDGIDQQFGDWIIETDIESI